MFLIDKKTRTPKILMDTTMRGIMTSIFTADPKPPLAPVRLDLKTMVVKQMLQRLSMILVVLLTAGVTMAQSTEEWFAKGLDSFRWQRVDEALGFFLKAAELAPHSPEYVFYVGICYHQLGRFTDAEAAYTRSLDLGADADTVLLRRGNLRWSMGNTQGALQDYTLVINANGMTASSALLNRANMRLAEGPYNLVIADYTRYLNLVPNAPDRKNIQRIIDLLNADIEAARMAEVRRIAEASRLAEEAARREAILADLLESLGDSGEDTKSFSAGSEKIHEDHEESILED